MRTDKLREEFDLEIRWRVFPLHPETPDEGLELADLFAGRYDIDAMMQRCAEVAKEIGLPFGNRTYTYNSRRALELGKWAEEQGAGEAFHMTVYRAYFVDGSNIPCLANWQKLLSQSALIPRLPCWPLTNRVTLPMLITTGDEQRSLALRLSRPAFFNNRLWLVFNLMKTTVD